MDLDPIVEEVRKVREEHAGKFRFQLDAICEDIRKTERACGHQVVSRAPKFVLKQAS